MDTNKARALELKRAQYLRRAAIAIVYAYERADGNNGGPEEMDWSDMDEVVDLARKGLDGETLKAIRNDARTDNAFEPTKSRNAKRRR